jgi:hypothetical protein
VTAARKPRRAAKPAASKRQAAPSRPARSRKPKAASARAASKPVARAVTTSVRAPEPADLTAPVQDVQAVAKYQTEVTKAQLRLITDLGQVQAELVREVASALQPVRT